MEQRYRSRHLHSPSYYDLDSKDSQDYLGSPYHDRKRSWYSFSKGLKSSNADEIMLALRQEAEYLRLHNRNQEKEIDHLRSKLLTRDQQQADLQAKWNFHSFKYQLLIDMPTIKKSYRPQKEPTAAESS